VAAREYCADASLSEEQVAVVAPCIRLDRDCTDSYRLTAAFIACHSPHAPLVIRECSELRLKCHDECAQAG
jgi:hypothetical protein